MNAGQVGASWALPLEDGLAARVPVVAVKDWLPLVGPALDTDAGRALVARHQTSAQAVLNHAPTVASFADSATGRGITAANATMARRAKCSPGTMRKVRYVLRDLGLAKDMRTGRRLSGVEIAAARAHHGGHQTNAASVWHLTAPRPALSSTPPREKSTRTGRDTPSASPAVRVAEGRARGRSGHLSSPTGVGEERNVGRSSSFHLSSLDREKSPTRARRAHARTKLPRKARCKPRTTADPRPMHLQRAAAEVVHHLHGMDRGQWVHIGCQRYVRHKSWHIGWVAEALIEAGIDTTRFDGKAIAERLTRYTIERGLNWPDRISAPIAFLRSLLAKVDWTNQVPAEPASVRRARMTPLSAQRRTSWARPAGGEMHAAAGRSEGTNRLYPPSVTSVSEDLATAATDTCVACSAPAVVRNELPLRTPVCDQCWNADALTHPSDADCLARS
ncbi:hypothetical protein [Nocardia asiatica]|uniref:hypothetical protein n=1 Tax=Nocardia asiatica TaxID=209252 RepID=UPI0012FC2EEB|nr:hypothetical protein [Nocardia asiatica]